jgi:Niemann-Pick C1 protein
MNDYTSSKLLSHFEFMAERSIPDELTNETNENLWIVVISYSAMLLYIAIAIGQFPSIISSGFSLALIGIFIVLASVISSMGIIAYIGIGFTMISAEVIPFLVLAIGVDNMFIIKNSI